MQRAPQALQSTLATLARLKYLIGEQLVQVGPVAPDLAASLASVAVAQSSFGQARYFFNWYRGESRAADHEFVIDSSWEPEIALLRFKEWSTWPHLVSVLWLIDEAVETLIDDWVQTDPDLSSAVAKVREEIAYTLVFSRDWVRLFVRQGAGLRRVVCIVQQVLGPALLQLLHEWGATGAEDYTSRYRGLIGGECA